MEKRVIIAVVLSILVLLFFQKYFSPPQKPQTPQTTGQEEVAAPLPAGQDEGQPEERSVTPPPKAALSPAVPEKEIRVETPLYSAVFSSHGATLKSWSLKKYLDQLGGKGKPIEMVTGNEVGERPFNVALVWKNQTEYLDSAFEADHELLDLTGSQAKGELVFSGKTPEGMVVKKIFTFSPQTYLVEIAVEITPPSALEPPTEAVISWIRKLDPTKDASTRFGFIGPAAVVDRKLHEIKLKELDKGDQSFGQGVQWAGYEEKYFLAAFLPSDGNSVSARIVKTGKGLVFIDCFQKTKTSRQGTTSKFFYGFYCGPKDIDILKPLGRGLEKVIDFGMLDLIAKPLLYTLKFFDKFTHNYGWAIILITILIKVIFFPLTHKSYKSMKALKDLQPQMMALKKKYSDDKEQLNRELLNLYRTYKVNPLGGCLPMLVQFPIFIAFYWVLLGAIELRHAPFALWIQDLSSKDPYYVTPVLMGASMFIQQKMTPTAADPTQAKMMLMLPIVFTFLFLSFPSGLVIYWLVSNILQIFQQLYIDKRIS